MTDLRETARILWAQSRPRIVQQADDAVVAARSWSISGAESDLADVRSLSHQLSGSLGTYAAALRRGDSADEPAERAARAAVQLDQVAHAGQPDAATLIAATEELRATLEDTG